MIHELHITSFKGFETLDLPLRPLTLLTGENGGGKSSVIQALGLLSQTMQTREWGRSLSFEGRDLAFGSVADVLNHQSARGHLKLGITTAAGRVVWSFQSDDRSALSIDLESATVDGDEHSLKDTTQAVRWMLPAGVEGERLTDPLRRLSWITAERTGPREVLPLRDRHEHLRVGYRGELAAGLLYWNEAKEIEPCCVYRDIRRRYFIKSVRECKRSSRVAISV